MIREIYDIIRPHNGFERLFGGAVLLCVIVIAVGDLF